MSHNSFEPSAGLTGAVRAVLTSTLPDQRRASRAESDLVMSVRLRDQSSLTVCDRVAFSAALLWLRLHAGTAPEVPARLVAKVTESCRGLSSEMTPRTRSICYSVCSEVEILNGRVSGGALLARAAVESAEDASDNYCLVRALDLMSAALALGGHVAAAGAVLSRVEAIGIGKERTASSWVQKLAHYAIGPGQKLERSEGADTQCGTDAGMASQDGAEDIVNLAVGRLVLIARYAAVQDWHSVMSSAQLLIHGVDTQNCPRFLVARAISANALAHIQLGQPDAALAVMQGWDSGPEHAVCFELLRANALLQMGQLRASIEATDGCVNDCPSHSLLSLGSVLLRRAVAFEFLEQPHSADAAFSQASHLAHDLGVIRPAVGLPLDVLERLLVRMEINEPSFSRNIRGLLPAESRMPDRPQLSFVRFALTTREAVLAHWLASDLPAPRIATRLHVSTNTLKTQTRSLYGKLGVGTREEAVARLEDAGFYLAHKYPHS